MLLRKDRPGSGREREVCHYQPFFDLRRNIAKVITNYSIIAVQKNILLDIFVAHETPNYFQGDLTNLLELLSELFKHSIKSMADGEICIRINHESLHKSNNCETELSIITTTRSTTRSKNPLSDSIPPPSNNAAPADTALNNFSSFLRLQHLCSYFGGNITRQKLDDRKTQYTVSLILQQANPARLFYLA